MILGDLTLYHIQVFHNSNIIFDGVSDDLPNEFKNYEITNDVDFKNNKLILTVKSE